MFIFCFVRTFSLCLVRTQVPRVQYGTGGYSQMPQGLLLERFLKHAINSPGSYEDNRLPKVRCQKRINALVV